MKPTKRSSSWAAWGAAGNWLRMETTAGGGQALTLVLTCWWPTQTVSSSSKEILWVSHVGALWVCNLEGIWHTGCVSLPLIAVENWSAVAQQVTSFSPLRKTRSMWWWTWTAGCCHSPSMCAVTSCIRHLSRTTARTPQTKKALLTACLDALWHTQLPLSATIPLVMLRHWHKLVCTIHRHIKHHLTLDISSACYVTQWIMGTSWGNRTGGWNWTFAGLYGEFQVCCSFWSYCM